jgi:predicted transcriptional regulator YdeE
MQEYSHGEFQVSGYVIEGIESVNPVKVIQDFWSRFIVDNLGDTITSKAYPHIHAIYYNYKNLGQEDESYDMLLGFVTQDGSVQDSQEIVTITIPPQNYKFTKVKGKLDEVVSQEWKKINKMPKEEVNRNHSYDMEMYSDDGKRCTIAVSVD